MPKNHRVCQFPLRGILLNCYGQTFEVLSDFNPLYLVDCIYELVYLIFPEDGIDVYFVQDKMRSPIFWRKKKGKKKEI